MSPMKVGAGNAYPFSEAIYRNGGRSYARETKVAESDMTLWCEEKILSNKRV